MKKKTLVGAFSWLEGLLQLYKMLRLTLGDMTRLPCCSVYRLDITISRSLVCFTGRNLQCKIITFLSSQILVKAVQPTLLSAH